MQCFGQSLYEETGEMEAEKEQAERRNCRQTGCDCPLSTAHGVLPALGHKRGKVMSEQP